MAAAGRYLVRVAGGHVADWLAAQEEEVRGLRPSAVRCTLCCGNAVVWALPCASGWAAAGVLAGCTGRGGEGGAVDQWG
jgi:hypothetical protein